MNTKDDRDFVTLLYDEMLADAGDDMTIAETTEALLPAVIAELEQRDRDIETEAAALIRRSLGLTRDRRANSLRKDLDYIADWYANPEDGASSIEPLMARAYRLGTHDGRDKTLRYWTADDFLSSAMSRYREASEAMKAAREYDSAASRIVEILHSAGADRMGALLLPELKGRAA